MVHWLIVDKVPFVIVTWNDAWKDSTVDCTLEDADEDHNPVVCSTAGWLLRDNDKGVLIANEYSPDGTFRGRTFIPKGMIAAVTPYTLNKKRARHVSPPAPPAAV